jgi:1,2-diacylglycerol 3-beta-galactosyltransferase
VRRMRIVIMTGPIGGGHISAAAATAAELECAETKVEISAPLMSSKLSSLPRAYSLLTTRMRMLWALYYYSRRWNLIRVLNGAVVRAILRRNPAIRAAQADVIIITQSMYCHLLPELRRVARKVVVMPTDLFGGPSEWFIPGADLYVVPSEQMKECALRSGIERTSVLVRRLPTTLEIARSIAPMRSRATPRCLVVGGSDGVGPIRSIALGLSEARCQPNLTVICGRNQRLASTIGRSCPQARVLKFVPDLGQHLREFDLVITKPGSLTIQEAIDAGVPFLLMPGNPGIEKENIRVAQDHGVWTVHGRNSTRFAIDQLFDHSGVTLEAWTELVSAHIALRAALPQRRLSLDDLGRIL